MSSIQQTAALFKPIQVGQMTLQHRVVLAPMTRLRVHASRVPGPQQPSYYAQRGSTPGTLLISEGTLISHDAGGWDHLPGIYTDAQIEAWKKVADAVHVKGSYIFLQLAGLGRAARTESLEAQDPPSPYVGPSAVTLTGRSTPPRPLTELEIKEYIAAFATAASNAVHRAGFDGVELHAAYGYLLDQFLQTTSNTRTDEYGGNEQGRTRFVREVIDAVVDVVGQDRVGIRISPWSTFQDMGMRDPRSTFAYLAIALRDKHPRMAYLHVVEPPVAGAVDRVANVEESNDFLREIWNGDGRVFISASGHTRESALQTAENKGGLVAFGQFYISNPDLPVRLQGNLPMTAEDQSTRYLPGNMTPRGYNDWAFADGSVRDVDG